MGGSDRLSHLTGLAKSAAHKKRVQHPMNLELTDKTFEILMLP
jgi:hypothetical protein